MLRNKTTLRWLLPATIIVLTLLAPEGALVCQLHRLVQPVVDPCDAPRDADVGIPHLEVVPQKALPHTAVEPDPCLLTHCVPGSEAPPNLGIVADVATPPPRF